MSDLKARLQTATVVAMRTREKKRVAALRLINAAIKQVEIDQGRELDDSAISQILAKQLKQRQNSIEQFEKGGRADLVAQEQYEIDLINEFLPEMPSDDELEERVNEVIADLGASSMKDMGRVMQALRAQLPGQVDMGIVSSLVRNSLGK
ncbi:MAG: GatB/YqeY domain-containing protein [Gammaproteobacteria bacterium]|nr:GatB/YqeY domain-containing protein [Gammaproteobacteria bacterium]